jgi:hypothetical protein
MFPNSVNVIRQSSLPLERFAAPWLGRMSSARQPVKSPALAVVILQAGLRMPSELRSWLHEQYAIEQLQTVTVFPEDWARLAGSQTEDLPARLKRRLALSLLCDPTIIVIIGRQSRPAQARSEVGRGELQRIVRRVRAIAGPVEVFGVQLDQDGLPQKRQVAA